MHLAKIILDFGLQERASEEFNQILLISNHLLGSEHNITLQIHLELYGIYVSVGKLDRVVFHLI